MLYMQRIIALIVPKEDGIDDYPVLISNDKVGCGT